jgi:hypothetical protein
MHDRGQPCVNVLPICLQIRDDCTCAGKTVPVRRALEHCAAVLHCWHNPWQNMVRSLIKTTVPARRFADVIVMRGQTGPHVLECRMRPTGLCELVTFTLRCSCSLDGRSPSQPTLLLQLTNGDKSCIMGSAIFGAGPIHVASCFCYVGRINAHPSCVWIMITSMQGAVCLPLL